MAKKKKAGEPKRDSTADYYRLKTEAVDTLVSADAENTPEYSREELNRYKSKKGIRIPGWVKALFVKFWFNGAVCFFILWGLGLYIPNQLDMLVVLGVAMGFVTDLLTNNALRFLAEYEGDNDVWMLFPKKCYRNLILNVLYSGVLLFFDFTFYNALNMAILRARGITDSVPVGVEPLLFGFSYLLFDLMFIGLKQLFLKIVEDAKDQVEKQR